MIIILITTIQKSFLKIIFLISYLLQIIYFWYFKMKICLSLFENDLQIVKKLLLQTLLNSHHSLKGSRRVIYFNCLNISSQINLLIFSIISMYLCWSYNTKYKNIYISTKFTVHLRISSVYLARIRINISELESSLK